jgi:hypothetical protein
LVCANRFIYLYIGCLRNTNNGGAFCNTWRLPALRLILDYFISSN